MFSNISPLVLVLVGGSIGSGARYLFYVGAARTLGISFPWGTLGVNIIGGLLMGVLAGLLARIDEGGEAFRLFFGVGILGGFTTFSAFSLDNYNLILRGDVTMAFAYSMASVAGSIVMLWAGVSIARML